VGKVTVRRLVAAGRGIAVSGNDRSRDTPLELDRSPESRAVRVTLAVYAAM
jgi:hypothetical protein